MSDSVTKAARSKAKDIRQGVIEQKPLKLIGGKKHIPKPWRVMHKSMIGTGPQWWCWSKFKTKEEAEAYIEKQSRSCYGIYHPEWRARFRIEGPDEVSGLPKEVEAIPRSEP